MISKINKSKVEHCITTNIFSMSCLAIQLIGSARKWFRNEIKWSQHYHLVYENAIIFNANRLYKRNPVLYTFMSSYRLYFISFLNERERKLNDRRNNKNELLATKPDLHICDIFNLPTEIMQSLESISSNFDCYRCQSESNSDISDREEHVGLTKFQTGIISFALSFWSKTYVTSNLQIPLWQWHWAHIIWATRRMTICLTSSCNCCCLSMLLDLILAKLENVAWPPDQFPRVRKTGGLLHN